MKAKRTVIYLKKYRKTNMCLKSIVQGIVIMGCSLGVVAQASNEVDFDVVGSFAKTSKPIEVDTKTFTFKTGFAGVKASLGDEEYGKFHLQYGVAYSPSEDANFHDANLSGDIFVQSIGYGYTYPIDINDSPFSLDLSISNVTNKHTGDDFTGTHSSNAVNATVNATSDFTRSSLALNYEMDEQTIFTVGVGSLNWKIDATASGKRIDKDITFSTDIDASGTDGFYFVESTFPLLGSVAKIGYRRSKLNTDTTNTLNEVYAEASVDLF